MMGVTKAVILTSLFTAFKVLRLRRISEYLWLNQMWLRLVSRSEQLSVVAYSSGIV